MNALHPGKSLPDYETQWSPGEQILARVVHTIGLSRFHRIPKSRYRQRSDGGGSGIGIGGIGGIEAHLKGKLIDVKNTDFDLNHNGNDNVNNNEVGIDIEMEMKWIAKHIRNNFKLRLRNYDTDAIVKAVILYPVELLKSSSSKTTLRNDNNVNAVLDMIQNIFEEEWSRREKTVAGPLAGVEIIIQAI